MVHGAVCDWIPPASSFPAPAAHTRSTHAEHTRPSPQPIEITKLQARLQASIQATLQARLQDSIQATL